MFAHHSVRNHTLCIYTEILHTSVQNKIAMFVCVSNKKTEFSSVHQMAGWIPARTCNMRNTYTIGGLQMAGWIPARTCNMRNIYTIGGFHVSFSVWLCVVCVRVLRVWGLGNGTQRFLVCV